MALERFLRKVDKTDYCWLWLACLRGKTGYGAFKIGGKVVDAHRVSYELYRGSIPKGLYVCHTCDNRRCVNPSHLFLGTAKDNWQDGVSKGRIKPLCGRLKKHPSKSAYNNGCRCKECREINNIHSKKYRSRKS